MMRVVRREENVKVRVVRLQRQLHEQQWRMNYEGCQKDQGERDRPRCTVNKLKPLHRHPPVQRI